MLSMCWQRSLRVACGPYASRLGRRYGKALRELPSAPPGDRAQGAGGLVGEDGLYLLKLLYGPEAPDLAATCRR